MQPRTTGMNPRPRRTCICPFWLWVPSSWPSLTLLSLLPQPSSIHTQTLTSHLTFHTQTSTPTYLTPHSPLFHTHLTPTSPPRAPHLHLTSSSPHLHLHTHLISTPPSPPPHLHTHLTSTFPPPGPSPPSHLHLTSSSPPYSPHLHTHLTSTSLPHTPHLHLTSTSPRLHLHTCLTSTPTSPLPHLHTQFTSTSTHLHLTLHPETSPPIAPRCWMVVPGTPHMALSWPIMGAWLPSLDHPLLHPCLKNHTELLPSFSLGTSLPRPPRPQDDHNPTVGIVWLPSTSPDVTPLRATRALFSTVYLRQTSHKQTMLQKCKKQRENQKDHTQTKAE